MAGVMNIYPGSLMSVEDFFKKYKDREQMEIGKDQMLLTSYRKPEQRYRLVLESFQESLEEPYFWLLNYLRYDLGIYDIIKITDIFSATEQSSFFGIAQQRIGLQQDKVSQFMGVIGKMIKELFQLVRELRILDERMNYYEDSMDAHSPSRASAEITLKGIWVDLVEQGGKNPSSVYGMARELQFTTLPDLFFSVHPPTAKHVDEYVERLEFNRKVKEVLNRKLRTYMEWKESTYGELKNKRIFTLKYLRQHFDVIRLYASFVKPYLKNIVRLQVDEKHRESPDLIAAFEGSFIEVEILGKFIPRNQNHVYSIILLHFDMRTTPSLNYQAEGYNRGPIHVGETTITYRAYTWTEDEINDYVSMRSYEDFELLSIVDKSIKDALDSLGEELFKYLREAGETYGIPEAQKPGMMKKPKQSSIFEPFGALVGGFKDMFSTVIPLSEKKKKNPDKDVIKSERKAAKSEVTQKMWISYKNFKKSHKMIAW